MKYTLLDMTQTILSTVDGDEVNSINDTVESAQIAKIIKTSYFDLIARAGLPEYDTVVQLEASGDADLPVVMYVPDNIERVKWIKYDVADEDDTQSNYSLVEYKTPADFLDRCNALDLDRAEVVEYTLEINGTEFSLRYENDKRPEFYTVLDDRTILFDSIDSEVDSTLQEDKTQCSGIRIPTWTMSDSFIPELDDDMFPILLNEAKSLAWFEMKQSPHPKAEKQARRGWLSMAASKNRTDTLADFDKLPNFGRR